MKLNPQNLNSLLSGKKLNPGYLVGLAFFLLWLLVPRRVEPAPQPSDPTIQEIRNEIKTLDALLKEESERSKEIQYFLSQHKEPVVSVIHTETQLPGTIVTAPLEDHTFQLQNGLPVARLSRDGELFRYETYDLSFSTDLVVGPRHSEGKVTVTSSGSEVPVIVPSDINVTYVTDRRLIEPQLQLGVGTDIVSTGPSIQVPWFHPSDAVDVASPEVLLTKRPSLGLISSYNIGKPLPVVDNVWLGAGPSIDVLGQPSVTFTVGAKL